MQSRRDAAEIVHQMSYEATMGNDTNPPTLEPLATGDIDSVERNDGGAATVSEAPTLPESARERDDALREVKRRCDAAKLEFEARPMADGRPAVRIHFRAGRESRPALFVRTEDIQCLLAQPFEKVTFLGSYVAICSYEMRYIEAAMRSLTTTPVRRLFQPPGPLSERDEADQPVTLSYGRDDISLTVGPASDLLSLLDRPRPGLRDRRSPSITIRGVDIRTHDQALEVLEKVAQAFFFQADLTHGVLPALVTWRSAPRIGALRPSVKATPALEFPRTEFDKEPMSLYAYARSAYGMPLLQFLAYYQVIEFYFPVYSKAEAQRRIRDALKSPAFRADRDADVGKILSIARDAGPSFGDERSQLRATINECINPSELEAFLYHEKHREFFSAKKGAIAKHKIPLKSSGADHADLRNDVAERIYEIRCKIVHTKSGTGDVGIELLLPFSSEAEQLHHDIELVQFVARSVLVSASSALNLLKANSIPDGERPG